MKKKIINGIVGMTLLVSLCGVTWVEYNRYEPITKTVKLELGENLPVDAALYIDANKKALTYTSINLSKVNAMKTGTYEAVASYKDKKVTFKIKVMDTKAPEVVLSKDVKKGTSIVIDGIIGKEISLDQVVKAYTDLGGIESVTLKENQISSENKEKVSMKYEKAGEFENVLLVKDASGNKTELPFKVNIVEDYITHVGGFADITMEQGSTIDWMAGITKDDKIAEVKAIAEGVDWNTPGEYQLKYSILGDDKKTMVEKMVKVTVVAQEVAQEMANNGATVQTTGGTKQVYVAPTVSNTRSTSSGNSSSSSGSNNSGTSGGGNNIPTGGAGSGSIGNTQNGNTWESGNWSNTPSEWE